MNKNTIIGTIPVGEYVVAQPDTDKPWIIYEPSNDGEENYYRDVYCPRTGDLLYCYGEDCRIESYDEVNQMVTLYNEIPPCVFTISYKQFLEDFEYWTDKPPASEGKLK